MAVSNVHITPVSPDPNATGRYGPSDERAHRENEAHPEPPDEKSDRLEISSDARESYLMSASGPDMDFARKVLNKSPDLPEKRLTSILQRIESGYYRLPLVIRKIVTHLIPGLR
jgi:hypothetical protein